MRFYAVRTDAIQQTHRALEQLEQRCKGSRRPSRALRVAQLYGYLQCRADQGGAVRLALRELSTAWHLQPRLLREDLNDLQALGWLRYSSGPSGTEVQLRAPIAAEAPAEEAAPAVAVQPSSSERELQPRESPAPDRLLARFSAVYEQHRPASWPVYSPRGRGLSTRLRQAIAHAGGEEAFWSCLERALAQVPAFWRSTYPQGRSGAQCAAVLFCVDRHCNGLGVEFWHVFLWSQAGTENASAPGISGAGDADSDLARADRLLLWDGHRWRGQGVEALKLASAEKRRLAELLEARGQGIPGTAAEQFAGA
ncbi:MAG: hypothetical protein ACKO5F_14415 [Synechococcus sp.]